MTHLKMLTIADIRAMEPCSDPAGHYGVPEFWAGTILDALQTERIPARARLWIGCFSPEVSDKVKKAHAFWNLNRVIDAYAPVPAALHCIKTAERFAAGECTLAELQKAENANEMARFGEGRKKNTLLTFTDSSLKWGTNKKTDDFLANKLAYDAAGKAATWAAAWTTEHPAKGVKRADKAANWSALWSADCVAGLAAGGDWMAGRTSRWSEQWENDIEKQLEHLVALILMELKEDT